MVGAVSPTGKTPLYSGQADCWLYDKDVNSKVIVRVHKRPRFRLFTPIGFAQHDCPNDPEKLLQKRIAKVIRDGQADFEIMEDDDWNNSSLNYQWTGETLFEIADDSVPIRESVSRPTVDVNPRSSDCRGRLKSEPFLNRWHWHVPSLIFRIASLMCLDDLVHSLAG